MKKLVFTIQMVALMAMFPVFMIVELNRGTKKLTVNNSSSEFIERTEEINIPSAFIDADGQLSFLMHR